MNNLSSNWWPSGPFTNALADAVLTGDQIEAERLSRQFKVYVEQRKDYDRLVKELCTVIDSCQWHKADIILERMCHFHDMVKVDLTYYQSVVAFERDTTILDRIIED